MKDKIMSMMMAKIDELTPELDRAEQLFGDAVLNEADWHVINDRKINCRILEAKIMVLNQMMMQMKQMPETEMPQLVSA